LGVLETFGLHFNSFQTREVFELRTLQHFRCLFWNISAIFYFIQRPWPSYPCQTSWNIKKWSWECPRQNEVDKPGTKDFIYWSHFSSFFQMIHLSGPYFLVAFLFFSSFCRCLMFQTHFLLHFWTLDFFRDIHFFRHTFLDIFLRRCQTFSHLKKQSPLKKQSHFA